MYVKYLVKTFFHQPHMSLHFLNTCITSFTSSEGQTEFTNPYGNVNIQSIVCLCGLLSQFMQQK